MPKKSATAIYVKLLESTGLQREQAEAHVQVMTEMMEDDLTSKQDLKNLETRFDTSIKSLETKLDTAVERLEHKMLQMEYRLIIKLGTIVTAAIAVATTVIKVF
jgi:hypothetical protein